MLARAYRCKSYEDHHARRHPENLLLFEADFEAKRVFEKSQVARKTDLLLPDPADLAEWLDRLFRANKLYCENGLFPDLQPMPIAFKTTKFVCKFFETLLFARSRATTPFEPLSRPPDSTVSIRGGNFPLFHNAVFSPSPCSRDDLKRLKMLEERTENTAQLLFLYLIRKRMTLERVSAFPPGIKSCLSEMLRTLRNKLPGWIYDSIPKLGFSLIKR